MEQQQQRQQARSQKFGQERESTTFAGVIDEWGDSFRNIIQGIAVGGTMAVGYGVYSVYSFTQNVMSGAPVDATAYLILACGTPTLFTSYMAYRNRNKVKAVIDQGTLQLVNLTRKPQLLEEKLKGYVEGLQSAKPEEVVQETSTSAEPTVKPVENAQVDESEQLEALKTMYSLLEDNHLVILAGTNSGKTIFIRALMEHMVAEMGGSYSMIDMKPGDFSDDLKWPNALRIVKDTDGAVAFIKTFHETMLYRMENAQNHRFPLSYLVIDELSVLSPDEETTRLLIDISNRGRAYGVRLVLLAQSGSVDSIGFSGNSQTLKKNFVGAVLELDEDRNRIWKRGRFTSAGVSGYGDGNPVPFFDCSWQDKSGFPMFDTQYESQILMGKSRSRLGNVHIDERQFQSSTPALSEGVTSVTNESVTENVRDMIRVEESQIEIQNVSVVEQDYISMAEGLMTEFEERDSDFRITEGQALAIHLLTHASFSNYKICKTVFKRRGAYYYSLIESVNARNDREKSLLVV